jgi:hypothetical protein
MVAAQGAMHKFAAECILSILMFLFGIFTMVAMAVT